MWTQHSLYQYTNKVVCVFCCRSRCTAEPSTHFYHKPNKQSNPPIPNLPNTDITLYSQVVPAVQVSQTNFVFSSFSLYACYTQHIYNLPCYNYVNNIWFIVTDMKLSTQSSAPLCSYLPLTSNVLLNTLLSQTHNLRSSLDITHQISHPHKMIGTMSVLYISTCNILNWKAASIVWTYPALFSKIMVVMRLLFW